MHERLEHFQQSKVGTFLREHHLYALLLTGVYYGFMSAIYFFTSHVNQNVHYIHMGIDSRIPYIKYFIVLYYTYYVMPEILLWRLAYKDKDRFRRMMVSFFLVDIIANIVFLCYNVKMVRESSVDITMGIKDIHSFDQVFDYLVAVIYRADKEGVCCFPSLHASLGTLMVLLPFSKEKEKRLHPALTVLALISGFGCILATVFIKQHYFIDVVAGILLSLTVYLLVILLDRVYRKRKACPINHSGTDL